MTLGGDIKSLVDDVRNTLGLACTLNAGTALGTCAYHDLSPAAAREMVGEATFEDEVSQRWAMIEVPAANEPKEQDKITVTLTGDAWIVRRVSVTQAAGVVLAYRCYCVRQLV